MNLRNSFVWLVSFFIATFAQYAICNETPSALARVDPLCKSDLHSWDCYGTFDVLISMGEGEEESKLTPFARLLIRHFSNEELWVEYDTFYDKSVKSYLVARPSEVELFHGWSPTESPFDVVSAEQTDALKIMKAAFPDGPDSIRKQQSAVAKVTKYVYPIGDRIEKISVVAHRSDEGEIQIQFNDFGEPIGPYRVLATWTRFPLPPLSDDYPVTQMRNKLGQEFDSLGNVRSLQKQPN